MSKVILDKSIKALVFDMAGTTVNEGGIVYKTLYKTIRNYGLNIKSEKDIEPWYGANKYEVLDHFLRKSVVKKSYFKELQPALHKVFEINLVDNYSDPKNLSLIHENIPQHFNNLRDNGVKIFLNTGYSCDIQESIIESLNMKDFIDDYISSEQVPKGRPRPFMIDKLMMNNNIHFTSEVIKFGDTPNDIKEGINAGCYKSIGVLSGASDYNTLHKAGASKIIDSVMDIEMWSKVYLDYY